MRVWDLPTRLFHWLLVGLMVFSWGSAEWHHMDWHRISGIALLGLLVFRMVWGVIGGSTARFSHFVRSPGRVLAYLRSSRSEAQPGHNPIGGYSVVLMLALLALQIGTGLFAVDTDGLESGQLSHLVSFELGRVAAAIHEVSFGLLQVVIGIHVLAILFYLFARKRNLTRPMVTGRDPQLGAGQGLVPAGPVRLVVALAVAAAVVWFVNGGLGV